MISKLLLRFFSRLRFPWLFALTAILFAIDLIVPEPIWLVDEVLLGLLTLLFGAWKSQRKVATVEDSE